MEKEKRVIDKNEIKSIQKKINKKVLIIMAIIIAIIVVIVSIVQITSSIKENREKIKQAEITEQNKRIVPNVVGMTYEQAIEELKKNDLEYVILPWKVPLNDDIVTSQSTEAGNEAMKGDKIEISIKSLITVDSDTSFTGATFKKNFIEFKDELLALIKETYGDDNITKLAILTEVKEAVKTNQYTEYKVLGFRKFRNPTLEESAMGTVAVPYEAAYITATVDNNTNNIICINFYVADNVNDADYFVYFRLAMDVIAKDNLRLKFSDYLEELKSDNKLYYSENVYIYRIKMNNQTCTLVYAANEEEVNYHKNNNLSWRLIDKSNSISNSQPSDTVSTSNNNVSTTDTSKNNNSSNNSSTNNNKNNNYSNSSNSNNNDKTTASTNNVENTKTVDSILNDPTYFTKYSFDVVNNAKTLYNISGFDKLEIKDYTSDLKPHAYYYDGQNISCSIYSYNEKEIVKDNTHPIYSAKFIYNYGGYCYVRKGVDLSKIKIEYVLEYKGTSASYLFVPKLKVNGNKLIIELNADCITDKFFG